MPGKCSKTSTNTWQSGGSANRQKKEKAAEKKRMNQELQRLRKEDRRSKLVEQETVRRAEKEAPRGARAEE